MQLGRAAAYAVFAVVYIAENSPNVPIQGKDIASSCAMPAGRLLKILQQLVRSRILASERGPTGGFRLRKPAQDISVLEIVEVITGPINGDALAQLRVSNMEHAKNAVGGACCAAADYARARLGELTINKLLS